LTDIASTTIADVSFLGFFPKKLLQILQKYANEIKRFNQDSGDFISLIDNLVTAFIYRAITLQKIIRMMIAKKKAELYQKEQEANETNNNTQSTELSSTSRRTEYSITQPQQRKICYASKCRLLKAKGIIRRPMFCSNNKI
jgi:hypothetical protein